MHLVKIIAVYVLLLISGTTLFAQYGETSEKQKAKYLYEIPKYLLWENDELLDYINIGLYKANPELSKEIIRLAKKSYGDGTLVKIIEITDLRTAKGLHLLYVGNNAEYLAIAEKFKSESTALVTSSYNDEKTLMINLVVEKSGQVTYQYSTDNLRNVNISVYQSIEDALKGGQNVTAGKLLIKAESELKAKENLLSQKQLELNERTKELKIKQDEIARQTERIDKQNKEIDIQKKNIQTQSKKLSDLEQQNVLIKKETEELVAIKNRQSEDIVKQQTKMNEQKSLLDVLKKESVKQQGEVAQNREELRKGREELLQLKITIEFQKYLLYISAAVLLVIATLSFFIFRLYRLKKKDNVKLAIQKQEIERQANALEKVNHELEKLSIVASETSNAISILAPSGQFLYVNSGYTRLYGYDLTSLTAEGDENTAGWHKNERLAGIIESCLSSKQSVIYESLVNTKSGEDIWAQTTLTPILNPDGNVKQLVLIDSDITDLKLAHEEIRQQKEEIEAQKEQLEMQRDKLEAVNFELEKLSLVASKTDNSVVIADALGEIEWVNDGFERMLGMPFTEFSSEYGSNLLESSLNPDIIEIVEDAIINKVSKIYSSKTITKKGRSIWIQTTLTPIFNAEGGIRKIVAIDADITKIKEAEYEIIKQKKKIEDSIMYASRIQTAVLPTFEFLNSVLPDHFVFFRPRDKVSGDYYWASKIENKVLITAADCTGHGVPGAFMSLLGIAFLNEIVNKMPVNELMPAIILEQLRAQIILYLRQEYSDTDTSSAKDGMDMAFCIIEADKNLLHFAGAHNSLLLFRNNEFSQYTADDMPIGITYNQAEHFTNYTIEIQKDDVFYMFSDGYPDQFGGPNHRKYMIRKFREFLNGIHKLPLNEQHQKLSDEFDRWKGNTSQTDDVLVMGMKF